MTMKKYTYTPKSRSSDVKHFARSDITADAASHRAIVQHQHFRETTTACFSQKQRSIIRPGQLICTAAILTASLFFMLTDIWYLKSGSMAPVYPIGSVIVTSRYVKPKVGSICAYRHNGITIIHRIISEADEGFILKGDANNVEDPVPITADDIEGVMLFGLRPIFKQQ